MATPLAPSSMGEINPKPRPEPMRLGLVAAAHYVSIKDVAWQSLRPHSESMIGTNAFTGEGVSFPVFSSLSRYPGIRSGICA